MTGPRKPRPERVDTVDVTDFPRAEAPPGVLSQVDGVRIVTDLLQPSRAGEEATIVIAGRAFPVSDLSPNGLCLDTAHEAPPETVLGAELRLADTSRVSVLDAKLRQIWRDPKAGRSGWTFVDPHHEMIAAIESFRGNGAVPPAAARPQPLPAPRPRRSRLGRMLRYTLFGATAFVLAGLVALSAFETFFTVHSSFAAVTAPSIQLRALESGALVLDGITPGMRVSEGQTLGRILNPDLESDLEIERTRLESTRGLIDDLESAIRDLPDAATAAQPTGVTPVASFDFSTVPLVPGASYREDVLRELNPMISSIFEGVNLGSPESDSAGLTSEAVTLDTQRRISELKAALGVQEQRVGALETAVHELDVLSPCDCNVYALAVANGDTWIEKGGQIAELVRVAGEALRIEARVPVRIVDRLRPGQSVRIDLPDGLPSVGGVVEAVILGGEEVPRAGFPDWIREDRAEVSLILAPDRPLDPALVGTAVEARIFMDPDWSLFDEVTSALGFGSRSAADRRETAPATAPLTAPAQSEPATGEPAPGEPQASAPQASGPTTGEVPAGDAPLGDPGTTEATASEAAPIEIPVPEAATSDPATGDPATSEAMRSDPTAGQAPMGEPLVPTLNENAAPPTSELSAGATLEAVPEAPPGAISPDAGSPDASAPDTASADTASPDAGLPNAASPDAASPDPASPDSAVPTTRLPDERPLDASQELNLVPEAPFPPELSADAARTPEQAPAPVIEEPGVPELPPAEPLVAAPPSLHNAAVEPTPAPAAVILPKTLVPPELGPEHAGSEAGDAAIADTPVP